MEISSTTRRLLIDDIRGSGAEYNGDISEIEFLAKLFDLDALPSTDGRSAYKNLRDDIQQHRISWPEDYGPHWVWNDERLNLLGGSDENLFAFLCRMVHPVVRRRADQVAFLLDLFNRHLRVDGFEIVQSGFEDRRPVYGVRRVDTGIPSVVADVSEVEALGSYVRTQIERMRQSMHTAPSLAIGTAKELIESVSKTVLRHHGVPFGAADEAPKLAKLAFDAVIVVPVGWQGADDVDSTIKSLTGALVQSVTRLAELRNKAGTGHGREASSAELDARHARLAVDAAATVAAFLVSTLSPSPANR